MLVTSAGRVGRDEEVDLEAAGVPQQLALGPVRLAVAAAHRRARPGVGRALRVLRWTDAAVVVAADGAVVAGVVAAPLELDPAREVH